MFFEGSEKKIEVIFSKDLPSLREKPRAYWEKLVEASKAQILSSVSNDCMDAYLLSESSLFVYDHYLVMITCGTTRLVSAVEELMKSYTPEQVDAFFYERKNELLPQAQDTDFFKDVQFLKKWFKGEAMRFGREDEHHLFLFGTDKAYTPEPTDHTMEVLMHGIAPEVMESFRDCKGCDPSKLRNETGISSIVSGQVDDFVFDPMGYSLNAIHENKYYTIHITPESHGSYISFETNAVDISEQKDWAQKVLDVFKPTNFDLVFFNNGKMPAPQIPGFNLKRQYAQKIKAGYNTQYFSYYKPSPEEQTPTPIEELI